MLEVNYLNIVIPSYATAFEQFCELACNLVGIPNEREVSISLTNDATIKELNKNYRNKDESTDVLSFAFDDHQQDDAFWPNIEEKSLGEVIISINTLQINAEYFKVTKEEELKRLVIHGLLHLLGEDHSSNHTEEPMLVKQEALLKKCNNVKIGV